MNAKDKCKYGFPFSAEPKRVFKNGKWLYERGPLDSLVVQHDIELLKIIKAHFCLEECSN